MTSARVDFVQSEPSLAFRTLSNLQRVVDRKREKIKMVWKREKTIRYQPEKLNI